MANRLQLVLEGGAAEHAGDGFDAGRAGSVPLAEFGSLDAPHADVRLEADDRSVSPSITVRAPSGTATSAARASQGQVQEAAGMRLLGNNEGPPLPLGEGDGFGFKALPISI
jgi:hypothetical protein